jgi:hypothetical protein
LIPGPSFEVLLAKRPKDGAKKLLADRIHTTHQQRLLGRHNATQRHRRDVKQIGDPKNSFPFGSEPSLSAVRERCISAASIVLGQESPTWRRAYDD